MVLVCKLILARPSWFKTFFLSTLQTFSFFGAAVGETLTFVVELQNKTNKKFWNDSCAREGFKYTSFYNGFFPNIQI